MTKEEIKALVREKMATKRIILFGAGVVAEEFYEAHKDKLNISHCVSNIQKEWGEGAFMEGELDVRQYRPEDIEENDYIVVCGPIAFRSIELQLLADEWKIYENFIESNIAAAIYENKEIALLYGQCVLRDVYKCIIQVSAFTERYAVIFAMATTKQAKVNNRVVHYAKELCDLYISSPRFFDYGSIYYLTDEELPMGCPMYSVSNLSVLLYWPQIDPGRDEYNEWYIHPYTSKRDLDYGHSIYRRADLNINRMILEGMSDKEIIERVSSIDFYSDSRIRRHEKLALQMVDASENGYDVKIGDYIRDNYRSCKLYQNSFHPNKSIIWEYIRRLLLKLNITIEEVDMLEKESPEHIHQGGDVPIYPCVAKGLGLDFISEDTKYEIITGSGLEYMTFRESVEHYIGYCRKARELMEMW